MEKRIPQRRCTACCTSYDKNTLIRVVKTPDGKLFVDAKGTADGRGAYICKKSQCLKKVIKSNGLGRALACRIPEEIYKSLERQVADCEK